ncbi:MAG: prolipoprotein diacylglyceryl transferase [Anaerolineae bacterium]
MYPVLNIGPFSFPTAGLIYIVGAWLSLSLVEWAAKRLRQDPEVAYGIGATALFAGLVGARLAFVAQYWSGFKENLLAIVWPLNSGYIAWAGLIVALAGAFFYGRAKQAQPAPMLDVLAPGLIAGLMFVSLADFLAGPGFGTLTRAPWAITQFSVRRHPVQIYELLVGAAVLAAWWRALSWRRFPGQLFLMTISLYSGGRLLVDPFRDNAWLTSSGFHVLQIISLVVMLVSLYLWGRLGEGAAAQQKS